MFLLADINAVLHTTATPFTVYDQGQDQDSDTENNSTESDSISPASCSKHEVLP